MNTSLWKPEFIQEHISVAKKFAEDAFAQRGYIATCAMVFAGIHPKTGKKLTVPQPAYIALDLFDSKDDFAEAVRFVAKQTESGFVMLISESWLLRKKDMTDKEMIHDTRNGISNHPDREEAIFITVENFIFDRTIMTSNVPVGIERQSLMSIISRKDGKVSLGDWDCHKEMSLTGRFTDFLAIEPYARS
jgi:hypothetical protein